MLTKCNVILKSRAATSSSCDLIVRLHPRPHNLPQSRCESAVLHQSDALFSSLRLRSKPSLKLIFSSSPSNSGHDREEEEGEEEDALLYCLCHHLPSTSAQLIRHLAYLFLSTLLLYVLWRLRTLRLYQLGVVGGDLDGRLLVSRCSDESDLRSSGFQTMPPTTRWHTGPLDIQKGERGYMRTFPLSTGRAATGSPLSFTVPKAEVLRYQLSVRLHRAVVVLGDSGASIGAEKGVMVHAGSPEVLACLWAG